MGTHPIFESDFDCLTASKESVMGDEDGPLNLVVLGHAGVGKSSLCLRFTMDTFPDDHMTTLITDTYEKWHGFSIVILVVSIIDRESFEKATRTYKTTVDYFKNQHPPSKSGDGKPEHPMPIAVVLNKVDLRETNPAMVQIERDEIMQTLKLHSSQLIETSALKNKNVNQAFETAIMLIPGVLGNKSKEKSCPIS